MKKWLDGWNIGTSEFDGNIFHNLFTPGEGVIEVLDNIEGDVTLSNATAGYKK